MFLSCFRAATTNDTVMKFCTAPELPAIRYSIARFGVGVGLVDLGISTTGKETIRNCCETNLAAVRVDDSNKAGYAPGGGAETTWTV